MPLEEDTAAPTRTPAGKKAPKTNKGSLEHIKIHITAFTASSGVKRARVSHRQLAALWPNGSSCGRLPTECNLAATQSEAHRGIWCYCMWANTDRLDTTERLSRTRARRATWTDPGMPIKMWKPSHVHRNNLRSSCISSGDRPAFACKERLQHVGEEPKAKNTLKIPKSF